MAIRQNNPFIVYKFESTNLFIYNMNIIFAFINIVGLAWCPLSKTQRIQFFIIINGTTNLWFEIIL